MPLNYLEKKNTFSFLQSTVPIRYNKKYNEVLPYWEIQTFYDK